jgi:hypothetical protein
VSDDNQSGRIGEAKYAVLSPLDAFTLCELPRLDEGLDVLMLPHS